MPNINVHGRSKTSLLLVELIELFRCLQYLPWWMLTSGATSQPFKLIEKVGSMLKFTESSRLFQLDNCRSLHTK